MLAQRLKIFTRTMAIVCAIMCVVILVAALQTSQQWQTTGWAIGANVAVSACTVFTTKMAAPTSRSGVTSYWIFFGYLLKIVVLFVALSLIPERVFGGIAAIGSILFISLTQIVCLFPRKRDPLLDPPLPT